MLFSSVSQLTASGIFRTGSGLVCFCGMMTLILWGVIVSFDRIQQVNKHLPRDEQFEALWWGPFQRLRYEEAYERLFPDRTLRRKERLLFVLGILSLIAGLLCVFPSA